jgi:hypothetical protein
VSESTPKPAVAGADCPTDWPLWRRFWHTLKNRTLDLLIDALESPWASNPWRLLAAYVALMVAVGIVLSVVVTAVKALLYGAWHILTGLAAGVAAFIANWQVSHLVVDPVRNFFATQAVDTGVSAEFLTQLWGWTLVGLLGCAFLFKLRGARWGWVACGAATAAMVWLGAPASHRALSVVLTVGAWSVLSVLALGMLPRPVVVRQLRAVAVGPRIRYRPATAPPAATVIRERE